MNLKLYTEAMEEVCQANGVQCVDLFTPTQESYAKIAEPLTTDGIHPNAAGVAIIAARLAPVVARALASRR